MADVSSEIDALTRSLMRVFEINGGSYSSAERERECHSILLTAFRLGAAFRADVEKYHAVLGPVVERTGWRCLVCGFAAPTVLQMEFHFRGEHPSIDLSRSIERSTD
jgi:hypothetical protein